jgi:molybdopterin-synthase adenylyltransferase
MITLSFAAPQLRALRRDLHHSSLESAAILLCVPIPLRSDDGWRLLVHEVHVAGNDDYLERTPLGVKLNPTFCLPLEKKARLQGWSLVYAHTHPNQTRAEFSSVDDSAEKELGEFLANRAPRSPHLALLFSRGHVLARVIGTNRYLRVVEVGENVTIAVDPNEPELLEDRFDRQIRAFGAEGQRRLASLQVGVVGLGGTGSLIIQQLVYLGVRRFIVVDDDKIEGTNLNRVIGALVSDAGATRKVDVAERQILSVRPESKVSKLASDVTFDSTARRVIEADFLFNCTDTHASRHVLNQAAHQYGVPLIDLGVSITVGEDATTRFAGHVKMLAPGLPCLWCVRHLDARQIREELMTAEHRAADPYFQGAEGVRQPAVISLNGVVSSVAVTMFLSAVAGVPAPARYVIYDGNRSRMNAVEAVADPDCNFCGPNSTAGWGDTYPLPVRRDV